MLYFKKEGARREQEKGRKRGRERIPSRLLAVGAKPDSRARFHEP